MHCAPSGTSKACVHERDATGIERPFLSFAHPQCLRRACLFSYSGSIGSPFGRQLKKDETHWALISMSKACDCERDALGLENPFLTCATRIS